MPDSKLLSKTVVLGREYDRGLRDAVIGVLREQGANSRNSSWGCGRVAGVSDSCQAACLPKEYRFETDEVLNREVGDDAILSPARDWRSSLESAPVAFEAFMSGVEDLWSKN